MRYSTLVYVTALFLALGRQCTLATVIEVPSDQPTIQAGIDIAGEGDTVLVAPGTYTGEGNRDIDFGGKNLVLISENGPNVTIIDCNGSWDDPHRGFSFTNQEDSSTMVIGFKIKGGSSHYTDQYPEWGWLGGAVFCINSSPTIRNCIISNNLSPGSLSFGGGVYCSNASPSFYDCIFYKNTAHWGGAIFSQSSNITIKNCTFIMNDAICTLEIPEDGPTYYSSGAGGAILSIQDTYFITNTIITQNSACQGDDTEYYVRGGISSLESSFNLSCSNIYNNSAGDWIGSIADQANINNNYSSYPMFCDTSSGDYHISSASPCAPENSPCGELVGALGVACEPVQIIAEPDTLRFTSNPPEGFNISQYPIRAFQVNSNQSELSYLAYTYTEWLRLGVTRDYNNSTDTIQNTYSNSNVFIDRESELELNAAQYGIIYITSEDMVIHDSVIVHYQNNVTDSLIISDAVAEQGSSVTITAVPFGEAWSQEDTDGGMGCERSIISSIELIYDTYYISIDSMIVDTNNSGDELQEYYLTIANITPAGDYIIDADVWFNRACNAYGGDEDGEPWEEYWDHVTVPVVKTGIITVIERTSQELAFDIKPGSCPNPLNAKQRSDRGKAVIPAAVLGTEAFDVHDIDPETVRLNGISPVRWGYEDVSAPVGKADDSCACIEEGADGLEDLTLKFERKAIVEAIMSHERMLTAGDQVSNVSSDRGHAGYGNSGGTERNQLVLTLTAELYDGTVIAGYDCVTLMTKDTAAVSRIDGPPINLALIGNHPNPFNPVTQISFSLPKAANVRIEVFNLLGQKVETLVDGQREAGYHTVEWNASRLASGLYLYRLQSGDFVETKKMLLLK